MSRICQKRIDAGRLAAGCGTAARIRHVTGKWENVTRHAPLQRKRGEIHGTSGDNESVHHYADQHVNRVCRADWSELNDSFDPSC